MNSYTENVFEACQKGELKRLKEIVVDKEHFNSLRDDAGNSPLAAAIAREQTEIIKFLLEVGVDANTCTPSKAFFATPLMFAALNNNYEHIKTLLLAGADPYVRNAAGETALDISYCGYIPKDKNTTKADCQELLKSFAEKDKK